MAAAILTCAGSVSLQNCSICVNSSLADAFALSFCVFPRTCHISLRTSLAVDMTPCFLTPSAGLLQKMSWSGLSYLCASSSRLLLLSWAPVIVVLMGFIGSELGRITWNTPKQIVNYEIYLRCVWAVIVFNSAAHLSKRVEARDWSYVLVKIFGGYTVHLLTHVLRTPTHFFFHSFIATMSYSLQTSFSSVMKDWVDKKHVRGTPTRSPSRSNSR